jgi:hypothetical protein
MKSLFSRENLSALVLALVLAALVVLTASSAPAWIYQGY